MWSTSSGHSKTSTQAKDSQWIGTLCKEGVTQVREMSWHLLVMKSLVGISPHPKLSYESRVSVFMCLSWLLHPKGYSVSPARADWRMCGCQTTPWL